MIKDGDLGFPGNEKQILKIFYISDLELKPLKVWF